nr:hypothetical protein [uncultured Duganella sp.]
MKVPGSLFISVMKMKKPKAPRVPVLENAFEVNLPKLLRAVKASGRPEVVLVDGDEHTVAVLSETRLAVHLGGRTWLADIVAVPCLNDRLRPLLKCPRAHEGNFQSLYWRAGELACRHCHSLRYRSNLAAGRVARARLAREKLLGRMGGRSGDAIPLRAPRAWRKRYTRLAGHMADLARMHYARVRQQLDAARGASGRSSQLAAGLN